MTAQEITEARKGKEQTIKVESLSGLSRIIAEKELDTDGVYFCFFDGMKTEVVR